MRGNRHLTRLHMHAADIKCGAVAIDIRYFIFQWERQCGENLLDLLKTVFVATPLLNPCPTMQRRRQALLRPK